MVPIEIYVNDKKYNLTISPGELLVDVIRERLGLTGTKKGCGTGECGACTVIIDGEPVNSCLYLAIRANGKHIVTIEGLGQPDKLHPIQQAFIKNAAVQCGFCAPGMQLTAKALLDENPDPNEQQIREGISGNICRCTGYVKIVKAIKEAAAILQKGETI
jgi:carbon-monoxide dehydrogenase small subunit